LIIPKNEGNRILRLLKPRRTNKTKDKELQILEEDKIKEVLDFHDNNNSHNKHNDSNMYPHYKPNDNASKIALKILKCYLINNTKILGNRGRTFLGQHPKSVQILGNIFIFLTYLVFCFNCFNNLGMRALSTPYHKSCSSIVEQMSGREDTFIMSLLIYLNFLFKLIETFLHPPNFVQFANLNFQPMN
jgi:hypothetical protein